MGRPGLEVLVVLDAFKATAIFKQAGRQAARIVNTWKKTAAWKMEENGF